MNECTDGEIFPPQVTEPCFQLHNTETRQWPCTFHFRPLPLYLRSKLESPRLAPCEEVTGCPSCPPSPWRSCFVAVHVEKAVIRSWTEVPGLPSHQSLIIQPNLSLGKIIDSQLTGECSISTVTNMKQLIPW